ncbi:MAG: sigma 54-interacting transcriptional regulator [Candidatus Eisenbacteria bacterium]|nr:sigma 54-interacting transcriptional regulator [Candidatus Eisenbacteria bacterium]
MTPEGTGENNRPEKTRHRPEDGWHEADHGAQSQTSQGAQALGYEMLQGILGRSSKMRRLLKLITKIASTDSSVLIAGESGTGKELVARAIHYESARASLPFLPVNCAAIPETLFESELFGYVRGAFTGATGTKKGLFEQADGGTLFLDEIAEMPPGIQVKLLRALQEKEVRRIGDTAALRIDVRLIAATNRDVRKALQAGQLREDLYYRLNVFQIELPPLRERRDDVPLLARYFLERYSRRLGKKITGFSREAQLFLLRHDYPGNVRELENAVERAVALAEGDLVTEKELPSEMTQRKMLRAPEEGLAGYSTEWSLIQLEREHIKTVLAKHEGSVSKTALSLGISRSTLWRKMREYGLGSSSK